jgi:proteic killer suppression protein
MLMEYRSIQSNTMIVAFETEKLRAICEDPAVAAKEFGVAAATHLRGRLADMRAGTSTDDLLVGNPRFDGPLNELLIIDLGDQVQMTWTPNHVTAKTTTDGKVDWTRVTRIRLLRVEVKQ